MAETWPCVAIILLLVEARSVVAAENGPPIPSLKMCALCAVAVVREFGTEFDSGRLGAAPIESIWSLSF